MELIAIFFLGFLGIIAGRIIRAANMRATYEDNLTARLIRYTIKGV
jgi:hypothetical protein